MEGFPLSLATMLAAVIACEDAIKKPRLYEYGHPARRGPKPHKALNRRRKQLAKQSQKRNRRAA
jgi:hypothetical protein